MDNILGLFEKLESQSLAVQPSRCVVVRNRNASCRRCAEACPTGAILVEGNDLAVAPERCIGCGTCATVCPTAALESKKPDDKGLLKAAVAAMQANDGVAVVMDEAMLLNAIASLPSSSKSPTGTRAEKSPLEKLSVAATICRMGRTIRPVM